VAAFDLTNLNLTRDEARTLLGFMATTLEADDLIVFVEQHRGGYLRVGVLTYTPDGGAMRRQAPMVDVYDLYDSGDICLIETRPGT
jgi:hypothetical protein